VHLYAWGGVIQTIPFFLLVETYFSVGFIKGLMSVLPSQFVPQLFFGLQSCSLQPFFSFQLWPTVSLSLTQRPPWPIKFVSCKRIVVGCLNYDQTYSVPGQNSQLKLVKGPRMRSRTRKALQPSFETER